VLYLTNFISARSTTSVVMEEDESKGGISISKSGGAPGLQTKVLDSVLPHWIFFPPNHPKVNSNSDPSKSWPVLIFLHGASESGKTFICCYFVM